MSDCTHEALFRVCPMCALDALNAQLAIVGSLRTQLAAAERVIEAGRGVRKEGILLAANLGDCGEAAGKHLRPLLAAFDSALSEYERLKADE